MIQSNPPITLNSNILEAIPNKLISTEKPQRMAEFFSFLGDANRLRVLSILANK
jgi:hypothetical protein